MIRLHLSIHIFVLLAFCIEAYPDTDSCGDLLERPPIILQENEYYCGPAAVRSVLLMLGQDHTQAQLACSMETSAEFGTDKVEIINELRRHGIHSFYRSPMSVSELARYLDRGGIAILNVQLEGEGHWSVAFARTRTGNFKFMDPRSKRYKYLTPEQLEHRWYGDDSDHLAILLEGL